MPVFFCLKVHWKTRNNTWRLKGKKPSGAYGHIRCWICWSSFFFKPDSDLKYFLTRSTWTIDNSVAKNSIFHLLIQLQWVFDSIVISSRSSSSRSETVVAVGCRRQWCRQQWTRNDDGRDARSIQTVADSMRRDRQRAPGGQRRKSSARNPKPCRVSSTVSVSVN